MASSPNAHVLMVMNGPDDGRVFEISKERVSIGAGEEDDIILHADPTMNDSRAFLVRQNNKFMLLKKWPSDSPDLVIQPGKCFTIGETELLIKLKYQV